MLICLASPFCQPRHLLPSLFPRKGWVGVEIKIIAPLQGLILSQNGPPAVASSCHSENVSFSFTTIMQLSWQVESIRPTPQLQVRFWSVEQPASFGCSPWCIKCSFAWHRPFVSQDICSRPSLLQRGCRTLLTSHLHAKVFRELVI